MDLALHDANAAARYREEVKRVWEAVFGRIDEQDEWDETVWERHRARDSFRLATVNEADELIGFAWGYTGQLGQFWTDLIMERLGPCTATGEPLSAWVGGHFEFVELAVVPYARRCGAGGALHDLLLDGLPHHRALLGTAADPEDPAVRLYASRGWRHLGHQAPGDQVMGKILPGA